MNRRVFLTAMGLGLAGAAVSYKVYAMNLFGKNDKKETTGNFPFQLSDSEWKSRLSPEAYRVLRKAGTERAFTSPLNDEKRKGAFHCAGCEHPLYSSADKYDSGTGWPSFSRPINDKAVGESVDYHLVYARTEIHCANCGGHLGHVFDDGPQPTGKRYCMNGVAMTFKPEA